jgi:hypothetical protein
MAGWQVGLLSATSLLAAAFCAWGVCDIVREWRKDKEGSNAVRPSNLASAVGIADAVEVRQ